ncbi:MAG: acylphosphatase [Candidatus Aenigmatarchaeota archaeon]
MKILIEGEKVQNADYRLFLLEKAMESGIEKIYARNINNDKIEVLVGDGEDNLKLFYKKVTSESPPEAKVKSIKEEPCYEKILSIERYFYFLILEQLVGWEEALDRIEETLDKALKPISSSAASLNEKLDKAAEKLDIFAQYLKAIDEKLDTLPERIAKALHSK